MVVSEAVWTVISQSLEVGKLTIIDAGFNRTAKTASIDSCLQVEGVCKAIAESGNAVESLGDGGGLSSLGDSVVSVEHV